MVTVTLLCAYRCYRRVLSAQATDPFARTRTPIEKVGGAV